jgi:hypothetical protein
MLCCRYTTHVTVRQVGPHEPKLYVGSRLLDTKSFDRQLPHFMFIVWTDRAPFRVHFMDRPCPISCSFYGRTVNHFVFILWTDSAPFYVHFMDRPCPILCSFYGQTVPHFVFILWTDRAPFYIHFMDRPCPISCSFYGQTATPLYVHCVHFVHLSLCNVPPVVSLAAPAVTWCPARCRPCVL